MAKKFVITCVTGIEKSSTNTAISPVSKLLKSSSVPSFTIPLAIVLSVASELLRKKYKVQQALIPIGWALLLSFRLRVRSSNFAA